MSLQEQQCRYCHYRHVMTMTMPVSLLFVVFDLLLFADLVQDDNDDNVIVVSHCDENHDNVTVIVACCDDVYCRCVLLSSFLLTLLSSSFSSVARTYKAVCFLFALLLCCMLVS